MILVKNDQRWFQLKFKESTLHFKADFKTILHLTTQKLKVIYSLSKLDINASQACYFL